MLSQKIKLLFFILLTIIIPFRALAIEPVAPNDALLGNQYYLKQIQADKAWNFTVGSEKVIVAVIDSGVDLNHPDLKDNIWENGDEISNNQKDDDHNGYIDDIHGWNFVDKTNDPNPQFTNDYTEEGVTHGTVIAGLIAASGNNNAGIAGIAWKTKIMVLRAIGSNGEGNIEDAALAVRYAADNGADIINMSFVGSQDVVLLKDAVSYAYQKGAVIVAAVGNDAVGVISSAGGNLDANPVYPVCYQWQKGENQILGAGAVNQEDQKTNFSNFGQTCLDINAPGVNFVSTQVYRQERSDIFNAPFSGYWNGTSFSTALVSGAAALIKSINKKFSNVKIISSILNSADNIDSQNPDYKNLLGKGRLNVLKAIRSVLPIGYLAREQILPNKFKAVWIKSFVPLKLSPKGSAQASFKFKNNGVESWQNGQVYLSIYDENDERGSFKLSKFRPTNKINFQEQTVAPGSEANFNFIITPPIQRGVYVLRFQLVAQDNGIEKNVLGSLVYKTIEIGDELSGFMAEYKAPIAALKTWRRLPIYVKIKNNGVASWQSNELVLRINQPGQVFKDQSWINNVALAHPIAEGIVNPGQLAVFKFYFNLEKIETGVYLFEFSLLNKQKIVDIANAQTMKRAMRVD